MTGETYLRTRFPSDDPIFRFLRVIGLSTAKYLWNDNTVVMYMEQHIIILRSGYNISKTYPCKEQ